MRKFGQVIAKLRKEKGLTQKQLGDMLNISYQAISKWENDLAEPSFEAIEKLADIFGISLVDFFYLASGKEKESVDNTQPKADKVHVNILKSKPWYFIAGLGVLAIILALCAFLIPVNYSSKQIYENYNPAVFYISSSGNRPNKEGTGFFINSSGLGVTIYSNIEDCTSGSVKLYNGEQYNIEKVVGVDMDSNLAIIQVDIKNTKPIKLGNSNNIAMGNKVYSITYTDTQTESSVITEGMVFKVESDSDGVSSIQTTASVDGANKGGVLFNSKGRVVGIISRQLYISGMDFDMVNVCVPINNINDIDRDLNVSLQEFNDMCKTFTFYSEGNVYSQKDYISGKLVSQIDDPEKRGYIFEGWYEDTSFENKFDFSKPVTEQNSCYAKWTPISYTIKFDANGGTGSMSDIVVAYDQEITLPDNNFSYLHYKGVGWQVNEYDRVYQNNQVVRNLTNVNNGVVTLQAIWEIIEYTVCFNGNGADNGEMGRLSLKYDQVATLPVNEFTKTGYLFDGWLYEGKTYQDGEEISKLSEVEDFVTLQAQWRPIEYTVRFVCYKQDAYEQTFKYDEPQALCANRFTKDYHKFSYWYQKSNYARFTDNEEILNLTSVNGDVIELTAVLSEYTYDVRYHPQNEVDLENCITETYRYSEEVPVIDKFKLQGYIFKYFEDKDGTIYSDVFSKLTDEDGGVIDLFSVCDEIRYRAYYRYRHKGETQVVEIGWKTYNEEFVLEEPTYSYEGYEFAYYKNYYGREYMAGETVSRLYYIDGEHIYLDAVYLPKQYNIIFDGNGATSGEMTSITATFDAEVTLPANQFEKDGFIFVGWDYNGTIFLDCSEAIINSDIYEENLVLKAFWIQPLEGEGTRENPYLITCIDDYRYVETLYRDSDLANQLTRYKLMAYLDFANTKFYSLRHFWGTIDGDGHVLKNITFNNDNYSLVLYGDFTTSFYNLGIENFYLEFENDTAVIVNVGVFVGKMRTGDIFNCFASGEIVVKSVNSINIGGFVGSVDFGCGIENSFIDFTLTIEETETAYVGGFLGAGEADIENSYANVTMDIITGDPTMPSKVGGMVGGAYEGTTITNCFIDAQIEYYPDTFNYTKFYLSDFTAQSLATITNVYTTTNSDIHFRGENQFMILELVGTTIDSTYLKDEEWILENLTWGEIWYFDGENYPILNIFKEGDEM